MPAARSGLPGANTGGCVGRSSPSHWSCSPSNWRWCGTSWPRRGGACYSANWWWVLAAVVAAMASMHSFAQIQRTLLRSAGVRVKQWRSEAAFYAGNALSTTMPGGPVLSATFIYRQQRIWGASPVVASWQLVMSGALQVIGLALLGLGGAFLLGATKNPLSLIFSLGGFIAMHPARAGGGDTAGADRRHRRARFCRGTTRCAASPPTPGWTSGGRRSSNSSPSN